MALHLFIIFTIFKYIRSLPLFPFISPLFLSFCVCVCVCVCLLLGRLISKLKQLLLFPKILYHSFHLLIFFFLPRWVITLLPRITTTTTTKSSTSPLTFLLKTVPNASTTTAVSIEPVPSFLCPVSSVLLPLFYFTLLI